MLNTSILPSALSKQLEFSKDNLDELISCGLIQRMDNHREHFAIPPCWMQDPGSGVMEEITNTVLGKWNNKLKAYVVHAENIRNYDRTSGMNEDHRWLHVDITATYYVYTPQVGQQLKGEIKKIGVKAAICIVFDVFTVTVLARDENEVSSWSVGDELNLEVSSFQHRRKGPIIRARSVVAKSKTANSVSNRKRKIYFDSDDDLNETIIMDPGVANILSSTLAETGFPFEVHPEEDSDSSRLRKKKKSKKHKKTKQETEAASDGHQNFEELDSESFDPNSWHNESTQSELVDDKKSSKKKKKKSSKRSE